MATAAIFAIWFGSGLLGYLLSTALLPDIPKMRPFYGSLIALPALGPFALLVFLDVLSDFKEAQREEEARTARLERLRLARRGRAGHKGP